MERLTSSLLYFQSALTMPDPQSLALAMPGRLEQLYHLILAENHGQ